MIPTSAPRARAAPVRDADTASDSSAGREPCLALAGGGTGGHIVPGLHLLAWLSASRERVADVVWFTSGRAVEDRVLGGAHALLQRAPFERVALDIEPPGGGAPSRSRLVLHTPAAVVRARERLIAHRSEVLLGLGGFTSLPAVLAARSLRIPVLLLEVNAHSGAATRWLSRFSVRVLHAWRTTLPHGEDERHRFVGPPLAPVFQAHAALPPGERAREAGRARVALGLDPERPVLVVLGGSQGSSALNTFVRTHAPALCARGLQVLHQTGPGKLSEAAAEFTGYRAVEYVDPAQRALCAATVVLARGGASTLAEIAAMRVPAFVAPYPGHADRHQERNALCLGDGVRIVHDDELDVRLRDSLLNLVADAALRERMSSALEHTVPTDSAARIWKELKSVAAVRRG